MSEHEKKEGEGHGEEGHEEGHGHGGGGHGHGGGHEEGHEGAPEWLISFADNVALIMGFFVILLAMNMADKPDSVGGGDPSKKGPTPNAHVLDAVLSIREAFNSPPSEDNPNDVALLRHMRRRGGEGDTDGVEGNNPSQQAIRPSDYSNITASIPFEDGSSELSAAARATIEQTAAKLRDQRWVIELRGHASPFEAVRDPDKAYNLSFERAKAVAHALAEHGLEYKQLSVVARGDSDRVVARSSQHAQDRGNQRVEVVVTKDVAPADPYTQPTSSGGEGE